MPIKGSFSNHRSLNPANIDAMCRETRDDSLASLHRLIYKRTPVGEKGTLRKSLEKGNLPSQTSNRYKGEVSSSLYYAPYVEYGFTPHRIEPRTKKALKFPGAGGNSQYATWANHPGYEGRHMFQLGAAEFTQTQAEAIARANAKKYLK